MASSGTCAIVGEPASDPLSVACSLTERHAVEKAPASFSSKTITTKLPAGQSVECTYELCDSVDALVNLCPNVVVMCYTPLDPPTMDELLDLWARALDRMYPRPAAVVVGTRVDLMGNKRIMQKLHERKISPISVEEACDVVGRLRLSSYVEVSAAGYINIETLEQSVAKAIRGEADKRTTPELVSSMRSACEGIAAKKSARWAAKRDASGRLFYINRQTRKAQWDRPTDYDGEEPELTEEEKRDQEQQNIEREEKRLEMQHEQEANASYLKNITEYEDRLTTMEQREDQLKLANTTLSLELEEIRRQIESNLTEREKLDAEKEEFIANEKKFAKYTVEEDLRIEQDLQAAKSKAFELEAMHALKDEKEFDFEIAEAVMRSRSLATSLREVLQDQLQIQKSGAASQAKTALSKKKLEDSTKHLAQLRAKVADVKKEQDDSKRQISSLQKEQSAVEAEVQEMTHIVNESALASSERHAKQAQLLKMCDELDNRIAALRTYSASPTKVALNAEAELQRLAAEQKSTLIGIASTRAENALLEVKCDKLLAVAKHAESEREYAFEELRSTMVSRLQGQELTKNRYFEEEGYCPMPRAALAAHRQELEDSIQQLSEANPTRQVRMARAEQEEILQVFQEKYDALRQQGERLTRAVEGSALTIRKLKKHNAEACCSYADVVRSALASLADIQGLGGEGVAAALDLGTDSETMTSVSSPDQTSLRSRKGKLQPPTQLDRLRSDLSAALYDDARLIQATLDSFSHHVRVKSNVQRANKVSLLANPSASSDPLHSVAMPSVTGAPVGSGHIMEDTKAFTRQMVTELNNAGGSPIRAPKVFRARSPRPGHKEWKR